MAAVPPEFVSGFVTGEGCFYTESGYDEKYKLKHRIRLAFCIEAKQEDREVLEAVKEHLQCGNIYDLDFGRYRGYEQRKWKPHVKYRVGNFKDIAEKVIPFFQRYPLYGNKRKAFEVFSTIAEQVANKDHLTEEGLKEIKVLVNRLRALNKKGL